MYTSPFFGDNIMSMLSFNLVNNYLKANYNATLFNGAVYMDSLYSLFTFAKQYIYRDTQNCFSQK